MLAAGLKLFNGDFGISHGLVVHACKILLVA